MNMQRIIPFLLVVAAATSTACDRRESTGTSDVSRDGQGEVPEAARDADETATRPTVAEPRVDTPPQSPETPPTQDPAREQQDAPDQTDDTTMEREEGDTLHRP
jgi:hypothetical protein